ncbi:hypothetical protein ABH941_006439 [Streptacidiphilus sp. EB103A]
MRWTTYGRQVLAYTTPYAFVYGASCSGWRRAAL